MWICSHFRSTPAYGGVHSVAYGGGVDTLAEAHSSCLALSSACWSFVWEAVISNNTSLHVYTEFSWPSDWTPKKSPGPGAWGSFGLIEVLTSALVMVHVPMGKEGVQKGWRSKCHSYAYLTSKWRWGFTVCYEHTPLWSGSTVYPQRFMNWGCGPWCSSVQRWDFGEVIGLWKLLSSSVSQGSQNLLALLGTEENLGGEA